MKEDHKPWCPIAKGLPSESNPCLCDDDGWPRRYDDPPPPRLPGLRQIYFFGPFDHEFEPLIGKQMKRAGRRMKQETHVAPAISAEAAAGLEDEDVLHLREGLT